MNKEQQYILKRVWESKFQSIIFYFCRIFPIHKKKIVFCCIEGMTGYTCNPKYIAEELIRRKENYELVWLVNDMSKKFPKEIKVVHNTLWNRAYQLSTAHFWIDNSRKQLEVRKRKGQIYIQTWHAKLGFKPTCLDRGDSFSKIAYLVSKHDSDMIDYVLSNSKWYDNTLCTGMIYNGPVLRTGSPRCDILVNDKTAIRKKVRMKYGLPEESMIVMYAPTFRAGSQGMNRTIEIYRQFPDYQKIIWALEKRFKKKWYLFLRFHPQLVAKDIDREKKDNTSDRERIYDVSRVDDMYEILAGCDAFITDYSSAAFDAAVMRIPIFLYVNDYATYEAERGKLLWNLRELPFLFAVNDKEMEEKILNFEEVIYQNKLDALFRETEMEEDGKAAEYVAEKIREMM